MSVIYLDKMKDLMKNVFEVADNLESKGINKLIPYIDQDTSFRDVVKMDVQLFIFMLLDQGDYSGRSAHALKRVQRTGIAV